MSTGQENERLGFTWRRIAALLNVILGCPYFASQKVAEVADVVFCPYNYIIDPSELCKYVAGSKTNAFDQLSESPWISTLKTA